MDYPVHTPTRPPRDSPYIIQWVRLSANIAETYGHQIVEIKQMNKPEVKEYVRYYVEVWSEWSDSWFKAIEYKHRIFDNELKHAQKVAEWYTKHNKSWKIVKEEIKRTTVEEYETS